MNKVLLVLEIKKSLYYTKVVSAISNDTAVGKILDTYRQIGLLTFTSIYETESLKDELCQSVIQIIHNEFRNSKLDSWYCLSSSFIVDVLKESGIIVFRKHYNNTILGIDKHITEEDMQVMRKRILDRGITVTELITDQEKYKKDIQALRQIFGEKLPLLLKTIQAVANKNMAIIDIGAEVQRQKSKSQKVVNLR